MCRIMDFINSEEIQDGIVDSNQAFSQYIYVIHIFLMYLRCLFQHLACMPFTGEGILVKDGTFSWEKDSGPILKNIDFSVDKGKLVAVVGKLGSGKSSLISAILGEMYKDEGHVNVNVSPC